jgi:hypothetical protein
MSDSAKQLEQLIEAKITAGISEVITDRTVIGFWTASASGEPKEISGSSVSVMVSPRETEEYESDIITIHADIRLTGAQEDDASCESFPVAFQNLMGVFQGWDTDDDTLSAAMDISGVFRCDALLLSNGGTPGWDDGGKFWYVDIGLDIKGCIVST